VLDIVEGFQDTVAPSWNSHGHALEIPTNDNTHKPIPDSTGTGDDEAEEEEGLVMVEKRSLSTEEEFYSHCDT
jgi:hypothetical protein